MADGGHTFGKKTFHKPTYCHHCSDLLWGLIGQGYICEVCNFIVHERCVTSVITPCSGIAPCIIKNPVAHCWSEPTHHKKRFCTVCRKRLDETPAVHCLICEYFAHVECQDFAVPDCKENATYVPGKELLSVKHQHHWREGNLPPTSKCAYCKKTCTSSECLTGYRCEWCGMTIHGGCRNFILNECNFGVLQPIYLPPHAVSIPRTEVPMEAIIGVQVKSKSTLLQRDLSCPELRTIGLTEGTRRELSIRQLNLLQANQKILISPASPSPTSSSIAIHHPQNQHYLHTHQLHHYHQRKSPNSSQTSLFRKITSPSRKSWLQLNIPTSPSSGNNNGSSKNSDMNIDINMTSSQGTSDLNLSTNTSDAEDIDNLFYVESNRLLEASDICGGRCRTTSGSGSSSGGGVGGGGSGSGQRVSARIVGGSCGGGGISGETAHVVRSKSFQEQGVHGPPMKNSRFFVNRHIRSFESDLNLDTISQNIEITVQDEHGNFERNVIRTGDYDTMMADIDSVCSKKQELKSGHVLGRILKRMRKISLGWRKTRCKDRRARSISEEFSSGDAARFREEEYAKADSAPSSSGLTSSAGATAGPSGSSSIVMGAAAGGIGATASGSGSTSNIGAAIGGGGGNSSCSHYRSESAHTKTDKDKERKDKDKEERDEETIKVFDGNCSLRRRLFRAITVSRQCSLEQLLLTALRAFHIARDSEAFYLTDLYAPAGADDIPLQDPTPVLNLTHIEGKRPAIFLRFRDKENETGFVRVYPGKLQCQLEDPFVSVPVDNDTTVKDVIRDALDRFGLQDNQIQDYRCSEVLLDRGVSERILSWNERPWEIMKQLGKDSIRQMELMRFYLQHKQDPHGPNIALFIGNLPPGLSHRNYEQILSKYTTEENKFSSIGPIYYEYGSVVITFEDASKAVRAFYTLRETIVDDKKLLVLLLPNIEPSMIPPDVRPLLVFVNVKSGGCQGLELISSFRKLLNPYQVFDLDNGGPLPGLYVFRQVKHYKILVCGGDGTIGWVLQCLDNVGQDSECSSPPCAIVPLGTGNDLARVLRWGPGYTGGEDPLNLLRDVIEAEEIRLDRWTVVFHPEDKTEEPALKAPSNSTGKKKKVHQAQLSQQNQHHQLVVASFPSSDIPGGGAQSEDNSQIFVMNNYFGIGIDADLCLDFHNAREENPNKFNSRIHNKSVYVKMGLRKIVGRKTVKELHKELRLEVDNKVVELPPVEGIIILNILSWGSGANPWGSEKEDQFTKPNHYDGVLEIVGVTGVVHLGQIQSGLRSAMRIAQGAHIKIYLHSDIPVQVDGEPWVQSPSEVTVLKSALKATMLKKNKAKMKRRNTEPTMIVAAGAAGFSGGVNVPIMSLSLAPQEQDETNNSAGDNNSTTGTTTATNLNDTDF